MNLNYNLCKIKFSSSSSSFLSMSLCLSVSFSLCLCLSVCLSVFLSVYLSFCLCLSLSLCLSVCLSLPPIPTPTPLLSSTDLAARPQGEPITSRSGVLLTHTLGTRSAIPFFFYKAWAWGQNKASHASPTVSFFNLLITPARKSFGLKGASTRLRTVFSGPITNLI